MKNTPKEALKHLLGEIPYTAELYWLIRQHGKPIASRFSLERLNLAIPGIVEETRALKLNNPDPKRVFIFASMHFWIDIVTLTALGLAASGNEITFGYYPYADWYTNQSKFDLRRQNIYTRKVLNQASSVIKPISLLTYRASFTPLPKALQEAVNEVTVFDTQYALQIEDIDPNWPMYKLRLKRNLETAQSLLTLLRHDKPDVVVVPNGTVMEFGIVYRVARFLNIPAVTFEFGDQTERIWLAQNSEIMRHDTDALWEGFGKEPITEEHRKKLVELVSARRSARLRGSMARKWQGVPIEGTLKLRKTLGLDDRPVVLLATNVLGDSLTLGRQVFSKTMAEWIKRTVKFFLDKEDIQLIIRVHPGEMFTQGTSMVDVVQAIVAELPEHIHLIGPEEKINTYDIVEAADLGLVYTTTVGLEMAMAGIPVIVAGKTHYSERGFTHDPKNWKAYLTLLSSMLEDLTKYRLSSEQVELAWRYAYLFFFEFPLPFPWHIQQWRDDIKERPIAYVLSEEGQRKYGDTFRYLVGEKLDWVARGKE